MAGFWHIGSLIFSLPDLWRNGSKNMRIYFLLSRSCDLNILNFKFPEVLMRVGKALNFILLLLVFSVFWSLNPIPFLVTSNSDLCTVTICMKRTWKTHIKVLMTLEKFFHLILRFVSYFFNIALAIISQLQKFKFRCNYHCQFLKYTFSGLDFKTNV